jgi:hypothetical protein
VERTPAGDQQASSRARQPAGRQSCARELRRRCERCLAARNKGNRALNLERSVKIDPYFVKIIIAIYEINDKFVTM